MDEAKVEVVRSAILVVKNPDEEEYEGKFHHALQSVKKILPKVQVKQTTILVLDLLTSDFTGLDPTDLIKDVLDNSSEVIALLQKQQGFSLFFC